MGKSENQWCKGNLLVKTTSLFSDYTILFIEKIQDSINKTIRTNKGIRQSFRIQNQHAKMNHVSIC